MLKEYDNRWLASHLYYNEPWADFLVKGVKPLVSKVLGDSISSRFFFIRYWERGPHIRLRFLLEDDTNEKILKEVIDEYFKKYYESKPSKGIDEKLLANIPEEHKWFPNNSVQYIEYEPEIERYGGVYTMDLAEIHFQSSSRCVFDAMLEYENWSYEKAMGCAIQLHLCFACAVGMSLTEVKAFYDLIYRAWFLRAYYNYEKGVSKEQLEQRAEQTKKLFEQNFSKQKEMLVATHKSIWEAVSTDTQFEQEWLNRWVEENKSMSDSLIKIQQAGGLRVPSYYNESSLEGIDQNTFERMAIYESFIHMTNNRLGILNRDEAFLGFLIKRSVENL